MSTPSLPNPPSVASLNRKIAAYTANAEAHRAGQHRGRRVRLCKACNEAARRSR